MSIISFQRSGFKVDIRVNTLLGIAAPVVLWQHDRGNELDAALLEKRIRDILFERMREIRAEAYAKGWKDKSAKTTKQTWFSGDLP